MEKLDSIAIKLKKEMIKDIIANVQINFIYYLISQKNAAYADGTVKRVDLGGN